MTEPAPVHNPAEQVEYWITQGIAARTNLSQDEARKSARHLIDQYRDQEAVEMGQLLDDYRCKRCGQAKTHYFHGPGPSEHAYEGDTMTSIAVLILIALLAVAIILSTTLSPARILAAIVGVIALVLIVIDLAS